ncbi:hypothetical protein NQ317_018273 [Molorchus minor]|uniref:Uncharacterized protein n=1 Tax=Molorchus minor TaxID=1323400 RepID=A0ABQ9K491_9CUCU|nr:hypothetical protein NQ317_018273 [Molorchus minor]
MHHEDYNIDTPSNSCSCKGDSRNIGGYKGAYKKCCLGGNTCYCREKRVKKPTLISRPNTCPRWDKAQERVPKQDNLHRTCLCRDDTVKSTDSEELLKRHLEKSDKGRCTCLKYSKQRRDYETYRKQQDRENRESLSTPLGTKTVPETHTASLGSDYEAFSEQQDRQDKESLATLLGTRTIADTHTAASETQTSLNLEDLIKFRKEHYFETHSTKKLESDKDTRIPEHTRRQVSENKLDRRMLSEPRTIMEPYGRSRCQVCNVPKDQCLGTSDRYKDVVCPCDVNESKVEFNLTDKDLERYGGFIGRFRRPLYFNTLALRQQRMLRYRHKIEAPPAYLYLLLVISGV